MAYLTPTGAHVTAVRLAQTARSSVVIDLPVYDESLERIVAHGSLEPLLRLYRLETRAAGLDPGGAAAMAERVMERARLLTSEIRNATAELTATALAERGVEISVVSAQPVRRHMQLEARSPASLTYIQVLQAFNDFTATVLLLRDAGAIGRQGVMPHYIRPRRRAVWDFTHEIAAYVDEYFNSVPGLEILPRPVPGGAIPSAPSQSTSRPSPTTHT